MSRKVAVSNLNYLCFGPSPVYVLYVAPTGELRFLWAREEVIRLDRENPEWRTQDEVALRFTRRLDAAALEEIHARVVQEAKFERHLHEIMARSTVVERVAIQIDSSTLQVTDPDHIRRLLQESGMSIVAAGYARQAVELYEAMNPSDKANGKIQLVHAYAQYLLDDYFAAQSSLAQAAKQIADLSEDERIWHERMRRICEYRTGRIDRETYLRLEHEASERLTGLPALEHRLEVVRHRQIVERDLERRRSLKTEIEAIVAEIRQHPEAAPGLRIAAQICELYSEGQECVVNSVQLHGLSLMRGQMGLQPNQAESRAAEQRWSEWAAKMKEAHDEAVAANHPMLVADALYTAGGVRHMACMQERAMQAITGAQPGAEERARIALGFLEDAYDLYGETGCIENQLRAAMLRADLHELLGESETARRLAETVLPLATAMRYDSIERNARDHLEGRTLLHQFLQRVDEVRNVDEDVKLAAASDAELDMLTRDTVAAAGMSVDRTAAVRRHHESRRAIARERLNWCRYIDLESDFRNATTVDDLLIRDPEQVCVCHELHVRSAIPCTDWETVLRAFKDNHCAGCDRRMPKQQTPGTGGA